MFHLLMNGWHLLAIDRNKDGRPRLTSHAAVLPWRGLLELQYRVPAHTPTCPITSRTLLSVMRFLYQRPSLSEVKFEFLLWSIFSPHLLPSPDCHSQLRSSSSFPQLSGPTHSLTCFHLSSSALRPLSLCGPGPGLPVCVSH